MKYLLALLIAMLLCSCDLDEQSAINTACEGGMRKALVSLVEEKDGQNGDVIGFDSSLNLVHYTIYSNQNNDKSVKSKVVLMESEELFSFMEREATGRVEKARIDNVREKQMKAMTQSSVERKGPTFQKNW